MNIAYGALALIISFAIAKYFSFYRGSKFKVFALAFVAESVAILLLGAIFYMLELGFFSGPLAGEELILKVFGFAVFLAVLVGFKAVNTNAAFKP